MFHLLRYSGLHLLWLYGFSGNATCRLTLQFIHFLLQKEASEEVSTDVS